MYVSAFDLKYMVSKQLIAVDGLGNAGLEQSHVLWILHQLYGEVNLWMKCLHTCVGLKHAVRLILSGNSDTSFHCCVVHVGSGLWAVLVR